MNYYFSSLKLKAKTIFKIAYFDSSKIMNNIIIYQGKFYTQHDYLCSKDCIHFNIVINKLENIEFLQVKCGLEINTSN